MTLIRSRPQTTNVSIKLMQSPIVILSYHIHGNINISGEQAWMKSHYVHGLLPPFGGKIQVNERGQCHQTVFVATILNFYSLLNIQSGTHNYGKRISQRNCGILWTPMSLLVFLKAKSAKDTKPPCYPPAPTPTPIPNAKHWTYTG